jgi:eukaryotic-like serine/threonine-protein kinase
MDETAPTRPLTVAPPAEQAPPRRGSAAATGARRLFVVRSGAQPSGDTRAILERRLPFFALLIAALFAMVIAAVDLRRVLFARGLEAVDGRSYLLARGLVVAAMLALVAALRLGRPLPLGRLRSVEVAFLAIMGTYSAWMLWYELNDPRLARLHDLTGISASAHSLPWFAMIVLYGTFIPNHWRRCAVAVATLALLPLAVCIAASLSSAQIRSHVHGPFFVYMLSWTSLGAIVVAYGAYRVEVLSQEASAARELGQYRLKERLGAGGMGEVYLGEHVLLRRPCAIKLIRAERAGDPNSLRRFEREVQATATLTHWNTVQIFDYGHADDGTFYYVMEYLRGMNLHELVERFGPLPPGRAVHFLRQVCAALGEAHAIGLIHRDIKPSNILACRLGGVGDVAKLLDFGLVRSVGLEAEPDEGWSLAEGDAASGAATLPLTLPGTIAGTPEYMAPEQIVAGGRVDARSDIYSLGATAYYLLTGRPPFVGEGVPEVLAAHLQELPDPPSRVRPDVPADLEAIVLRCLSKEPSWRFADSAALAEALALCQCAGQWTEAEAARWWSGRSAAEGGTADDADIPETRAFTAPTAG